MAITTIDAALAGMQYPREFVKAVTGTMVAGRPHALWYLAGIPPAAVACSAGIDGEVLTSRSGQLPFTNPGAGNTYLARLQGQATIAGSLLLCDRLWHNNAINETIITLQAIAGAQIPARDENGSNAGVGVYAAAEIITAVGAGIPTLTLNYTDQDGNTGATATNIVATVASSIAGSFYPIGLAAGDTGIRAVEGITLSATWTSGEFGIVLYRILARLELTAANIPNAIDALTSGFVRMYNNSVPFLVFIPSATTSSNITGHALWSQG